MKHNISTIIVVIFFSLFLSGCYPKPETNITPSSPSPIEEVNLDQANDTLSQYEKVCSWVDKSDIIIELTFDEGITKDTSYEAGFYYSPIMSNMRLARKDCNYRTGFTFEEMKNMGAVQVGVRGYTDNVRRQIEAEPVSVIFDSEGKPNISTQIKVKVLN